jgi:hypothetical protein
MRPERWGKMSRRATRQGRPLVLPSSAMGPNNAIGVANGAAQGYAGNLRGLDVYLDPNIPNNLGDEPGRDLHPLGEGLFLYESAPKFETFEQTYAGTLSLYARGYEYYGIIANRYPGAISLITGTGLSTLSRTAPDRPPYCVLPLAQPPRSRVDSHAAGRPVWTSKIDRTADVKGPPAVADYNHNLPVEAYRRRCSTS